MLRRFLTQISSNESLGRSRFQHSFHSQDLNKYLLAGHVEVLETRQMLSSVFPAYVGGDFTFGDPNSPAPYGLENTFELSSLPNATKTIYLDFNGHHSVDNAWGHDIMFPAFDRDGDPTTFSDAELIEIQVNFQSVAEDYLPFDVNVTTKEPPLENLINTGGPDDRWGIRALQTQATGGFGNGIGGVAFLHSFDWDEDTPAFSFNKGHVNGSMTISHEIGHTVGLVHDGLGNLSYHPGDGTGETGWGPIMGAPFGQNLVHFSNGDYPESTSTEDDFDIITSENGFGYRPDDHAEVFASATRLNQTAPTEVSGWGFIGDRNDIDTFRFNTGTGLVNFDIEPYGENPNLDILSSLYDEHGNLISQFNPVDDLNGSFSLFLTEGTYYITIDGTGRPGRYSDYGSAGFYTIVGTVVESQIDTSVTIAESGTTAISNLWTTVNLSNEFINPIVVVGPGGNAHADPYTVRVQNVTKSSFDVRIEEWGYLDRVHDWESISYLVVEEGTHQVNGTTIMAGQVSVDHTWSNVYFDLNYEDVPIVMSQVTTRNGGQPIVTRTRSVDQVGFQIRLQEEEAANQIHNTETVDWVSINPGAGQLGERMFHAIQMDNSVGHNPQSFDFANGIFGAAPALLGNLQTFIGQNPANLRANSVDSTQTTVFAEEEQSQDSETQHIPEGIGLFAIEEGVVVIDKPIGETGVAVGVDDQWHYVQLEHTYINPVVIASPPTYNDTAPVSVRVRNVTSSGFEIRIHEWNYLDQQHGYENVNYMVVEAGTHRLNDGRIIAAGNAKVNHDFAAINFTNEFDDTPIVFTQVSTQTGFSTVTTRNKNVTTSGFQTRLQEEEAADDRHAVENVGWVAMEQGTTNSGGLQYDAFSAYNTVDHMVTDLVFAFDFLSVPVIFADMQSFYGNNTATLRYAGFSSTRVSTFVEEEQSLDNEVGHLFEDVGVLAMRSGAVAGITIEAEPNGGGSGGNAPLSDPSRYAVVPRITSIKDPVKYGEMALPFHTHSSEENGDHSIYFGGCGCGLCSGQVSPFDVAVNSDGFEQLSAKEQFAVAHQILNSQERVQLGPQAAIGPPLFENAAAQSSDLSGMQTSLSDDVSERIGSFAGTDVFSFGKSLLLHEESIDEHRLTDLESTMAKDQNLAIDVASSNQK